MLWIGMDECIANHFTHSTVTHTHRHTNICTHGHRGLHSDHVRFAISGLKLKLGSSSAWRWKPCYWSPDSIPYRRMPLTYRKFNDLITWSLGRAGREEEKRRGDMSLFFFWCVFGWQFWSCMRLTLSPAKNVWISQPPGDSASSGTARRAGFKDRAALASPAERGICASKQLENCSCSLLCQSFCMRWYTCIAAYISCMSLYVGEPRELIQYDTIILRWMQSSLCPELGTHWWI